MKCTHYHSSHIIKTTVVFFVECCIYSKFYTLLKEILTEFLSYIVYHFICILCRRLR